MHSQNGLAHALRLSEKEAAVYSALMQLGTGKARTVAHVAKLPRTTVKSILDRLVESGLVVLEQGGRAALYAVEDPSTVVEKEHLRVATLKKALDNAASDFFVLDRRVGVKVYDTPDGVVGLLTRTIARSKAGDVVQVYEAPGSRNYEHVMSDAMFEALTRERAKKKIHLQVLMSEGEERHMRAGSRTQGITIRLLPKDITFRASLWIFGHSVVLFSGKHTLAVEITHSAMHESMKSVYEHLWHESKPYP